MICTALVVLFLLLAPPAMAAHRYTLRPAHWLDVRCALGVHAHFLTPHRHELPRTFFSAFMPQYEGTEGSSAVSDYDLGRYHAEVDEWPGAATLDNYGRGPLRVRWHCRRHARGST